MKPSYEHKIGKVTYNGQVIELSGGTSDEWQPNPTWWDIEKILEEDTRDYPAKAIMLLYANDVEEETFKYGANAYATSDGAFYEGSTVTHNWDLTKDKPCLVDGVEQFKTRYVIAYYNNTFGTNAVFYEKPNIVYLTTKSDSPIGSNSSNVFKSNYAMEAVKKYDTSAMSSFSELFGDCASLQSIPLLDTSKVTSFDRLFNNCYSLKTIPQLNTASVKLFSKTFSGCSSLKTIPQLDTSNGTDFSSMFSTCYSLKTIPQLNTNNGTNFSSMFNNCYSLQTIPQLDTSSGTNFSSMFNRCYSLQTIPQLDTSLGTNFGEMFNSCTSLRTIPQLDTSNGTNFANMFKNCSNLRTIPQLNTSAVTRFDSMFSGCKALKTITLLNLIKAANVSSIFSSCTALENLTLKNIKITIQIGSGTSYGHLLTLDSLLNTIKELWDNSTGSSTLTLTVGSANLTKLANVYVKLVDVTDEMRVEDEYIDNKKPFVVCESTDEGAMLITEYVTSKNWQLA